MSPSEYFGMDTSSSSYSPLLPVQPVKRYPLRLGSVSLAPLVARYSAGFPGAFSPPLSSYVIPYRASVQCASNDLAPVDPFSTLTSFDVPSMPSPVQPSKA